MRILSSDEWLTVAEEESKQTEKHYRDLVFGLLDLSIAVFFPCRYSGKKQMGS